MSKIKNQSNDEKDKHLKFQNIPKIRKSSLVAPGLNNFSKALFEPTTIETNSTQFSIVQPGICAGDSILKYNNPQLHALGTRIKQSKPVNLSSKPIVNKRIVPPTGQGIISLLSKKPLAQLPDPPMVAIEHAKNRENLEKLSLDFHEDPIAYLSRRKDGRGHLFIYMKYAKSPQDPSFSPYELVKVTYNEIGKDYFTMSANGVTHIEADGNTENFSLDAWAREDSLFKALRKLRTFKYYCLWKPLRLWKYFIMVQHFNETADKSIDHPILYNQSFSSVSMAVNILLTNSSDIIMRNLLCFYQNKKYKLNDFKELCNENMIKLKEEYMEFISDITILVSALDSMISDPETLQVRDTEFAEIKRKNPNINQLIVLERKKDAEVASRANQMENEMSYLCNYLRIVDYMLLESLRESTFKAYKKAEFNCAEELSAIFQADLYFSEDGRVAFDPSFEELKNEVEMQFQIAFQTLDKLPRILKQPPLRGLLKNVKSLKIQDLFTHGPTFETITSCSSLMNDVEEHILSIIKRSYDEAKLYADVFQDFYSLYELGQTWNTRNFVITASGEVFKGPLSLTERISTQYDEFLLHPERSPIIDLKEMKQLIQKLMFELERVETIKSGNTRGILHVDSRNLKINLTPIPFKSLKELNELFKELITFKTELLIQVFKTYSMNFRAEPITLEGYVEFCDLLDNSNKVIPQIKKEISFIDELIELIEFSGYESEKNQLHKPFQAFLSKQENALEIRKNNQDKFEFLLSQHIKSKQRKIIKYREISFSNIPLSMSEMNNDLFAKQTASLKAKFERIKPLVQDAIHFEKVLCSKDLEFPELNDIETNIHFAEQLSVLIRLWEGLSSEIKDVPFLHINSKEFITTSQKLREEIDKLKQSSKRPSPLLSEISVDFNEIWPYTEQLSQLSNGRMQSRHWIKLFESCAHKGEYNSSITIQQLLSKGILSNVDMIRDITIKSQGEFQLENEFQGLRDHWNEIELPIKEPITEEEKQDVRLERLDILYTEIHNTAIELNSMLVNKFVSGIYDDVYKMAQSIDHCVAVLDQWKKFESNWIIISHLMEKDEIADILELETSTFELIQTKWKSIVDQTYQDQRLLTVCSIPHLLEDLTTNNADCEIILDSLNKLVNKKRTTIPRLYFLSNDEIIHMLSTEDFKELTSEIVKLMMYVSDFSIQTTKENEILTTSHLKDIFITGLVGEDGDVLPFTNPVQCEQNIDEWVPNLFTSMKEATKEEFVTALSKLTSTNLDDWIITVTSYIAILTTHVSFTRDIEDCLNNLEINPKGFLVYQNAVKQKMQDLVNIMTKPLSSAELMKVSSLLTTAIFQFEKTRMFHDSIHNISPERIYHDMMKFKYDANASNITIQFGENIWIHGNEFWGKANPLIITPSIEHAMLNMYQARVYDQVSLLFGPFGVGKTELIRTFASTLGYFIYSAAAFPSFERYFGTQVLTGAALSGSWVLFSEIEQLSSASISFLFDTVRSINDATITKSTYCNVNGEMVKLNQNTRIFFSSSLDSYINGKLPPHLRNYVRPISLSAPLVRKIVETKLLITGYKTIREISTKLDEFVTAIIPLFNLTQSRLQHCLRIIDSAQDLLRQLMHSNKVEFINYYEDSQLVEYFSISRSGFDHFRGIIDDSQMNLLIDILYSHFPIFDSHEQFKSYITNPFNFFIDKILQVIKRVVEQAQIDMDIDFPVDYLADKTMTLFLLMMKFPCIIISGPPNSGKTILVELLSRALSEMVTDTDLMNHYKGIMPMKMYTIYQNSNSWEEIFGTVDKHKQYGQVWTYGFFQTVLTNLNFFRSTHHRVLRFDGKITQKFSQFLYQFVSEPNLFRINSLGSFIDDSSFHCLVETDDISHLTPALLSACGLLSLSNVQTTNGLVKALKSASLPFPNYPFSLVKKKFGDKFSEEEYSILRNLFDDVAPKILSKVATLPCLIDIFALADKYAEKSAITALQYILSCKVDVLSNEENAKYLMISGFFDIFSSLLKNDQKENFESWICNEFDLKIPESWDGFEVTEQFVEIFPKPTLSCCHITNDTISPIDHSLLTSRTFVHIEDGGTMPLFIEDVVIPNPCFLIPTIMLNASPQTHSNILLFGPKFSGKSSLLEFQFHNTPDFSPIEIALTSLITTNDIIEIIKTQTDMTKKLKINFEKPKIYALIFTNIDKAQSSVLEFVRQIATTSTFYEISHIDTKIYDEIKLDNYFVVVKTTDISNLSNRFISQFIPIQLSEYPATIKRFICKKAMNAFGINSDFIMVMNIIMDILDIPLSKILNIIIGISHVPERAAASNSDKDVVLRLLLSEIYSICFNCDNEKFNEFLDKARSKLDEHGQEYALKAFEKDRIFTAVSYQFTPKIGKFNIRITNLNDLVMKKKISDFLQSNVSDLTLTNFLKLSLSLMRPGNHCIISSITGSARIATSKLFASIFGFAFIDLNHATKETFLDTLKNATRSALLDNKMQLIALRVNEDNIDMFNILCSTYGYLNMNHLFSIEEIDDLIKNISLSDQAVDFHRRREWIIKIKYMIRSRCRLVIAMDCAYDKNLEIFEKVGIAPPTVPSISENFVSSIHLRTVFQAIKERIDPLLPYRYVNQYYDFIKTFLKYNQSSLFEPKYNVQTVIDFLERLSAEASVFQESLNKMQPELDTLKKELDEKKQVIDSFLSAMQEKESQLKEELELKFKDLNDKKSELVGAESDLKAFEDTFKESRNELEQLNENDLNTVRLIEIDSNPILISILDMICLLRGIEQEKRKEVLDDPEFLNQIKNIDETKISQEVNTQVNAILNSEALQKNNLESAAPILLTIHHYISFISLYAERCIAVRSIKTEIDIREKALAEFKENMDNNLKEIKKDEDQNAPSMKLYKEIQEKYKQMQKDYELTKSQKEKMETILKDTDSIVERWKKHIEVGMPNNDTKCGDSILFALYLSFCGVCKQETRNEILNIAVEELRKATISTSFVSPIQSITAQLIKKPSVTIATTDLPTDILREIEHLFNSPQQPLLIDPDSILIDSFLNANKAYSVSVNSYDFESALIESMKEGKILFITDVDYLHCKIALVSRLLKKDEITLNNITFVRNNDFKPILVTNITDPTKIPLELSTRTTIVNIYSADMKYITNLIFKHFVNHFDPRYMSIISDTAKADVAANVTIPAMESEILKRINKMATSRQKSKKYSYLNDKENLSGLALAKTQYKEAIDIIEYSEKMTQEMKKSMELLNSIISICNNIWYCLSHYMPKVRSHYKFEISQFGKVLSNALHSLSGIRTSKITQNQQTEIRKAVLNSLLNYLFPSFSIRDATFFMFLTAFMSQNRSLSDLSGIINNLNHQTECKYSIEKKEKLNEDDIIEKLKTANISDFFDYTMTYILQFFGDDFLKNFPVFQVENIFSTSPSTPTILLSNSIIDDPISLITSYVISKARMDNFRSISLSDDVETYDECLKTVRTAITHGNWILVHYWSPSIKAASILNELMFLLQSIQLNSNFRIIISTHSTEFISPQFINRCRKILIETYPSIRQTMKLFYSNYNHLLRNAEKNTALKRIVYIALLTLGSLNFRSFLIPVGFKLFNNLQVSTIREVIDYVKPLVDQEIPIRNLREYIKGIAFGNCTIETQDRRSMRAIFATLFNDKILKEDSNFMPHSNESSIWLPPTDWSTTAFQNHLASMPLFQTTDILFMHRNTSMPFLKWNISIYLSRSFLSILNIDQNEYSDDEVEQKFKDTRAAIPSLILIESDTHSDSTLNETQNESPLLLFWYHEINFLNNVLSKISKNIDEMKPKIRKYIINNQVPPSWHRISKLPTILNLKEFLLHLGERRKFLINSVKNPLITEINLQFVDNAKGFFSAYLHEYAFRQGLLTTGLSYEFGLIDPEYQQDQSNCPPLILTGLYSLNARIDKDFLVIPKEEEFNGFSEFPPLQVTIIELETNPSPNKSPFICPLYKYVFMRGKCDPSCFMMSDGETDNYIMDVYIPTSCGDKFWLLNGTALYCHVPHNFV